jgi:hypothetical protein
MKDKDRQCKTDNVRQTMQWSTKRGQKVNDLQNITQTTKDRTTRTPLKAGINSCILMVK